MLSKWSRELFSKTKMILHGTLTVIFHLDMVQENHILSPDEHDLHQCLKKRVIILAIIERELERSNVHILQISRKVMQTPNIFT
jgi:predicted amino acid-binding ACT domain protein